VKIEKYDAEKTADHVRAIVTPAARPMAALYSWSRTHETREELETVTKKGYSSGPIR
jgi:hypothetical protein